MDNASGHTINLANSIIGVSILAMPYCFRQCGILLSICLLLISSIISRLACHFLLKSAIIARRKTFEFLAFHIFGSLGKFSIEIGMIGFLLGTCIAFFVVMGDLGPAIISEMTGAHIGNALRNSTLVALAVLCVLPLGLLRNVDSLNGVSRATIGFYCCLVLKIVIEALPHIFLGDWVSEVTLWRPAGILQCLPIFSMALFCQTQLFEIYQVIPNASLEKMNSMIRVAVNMCTWVYIFVGAFGYIAFFQKPFAGNILLSFTPSIASDIIKLGFVLSLAFSFPLVIFPCRASLHSLLYKGTSYTNLHEGSASNYIPEGKFKLLTLIIVSVSLIIGIMIPNIELVLGLIGSTIGVMICVLFPVTCFICISPKNTNERLLAQIMLFVGIIVMVLGTYANLQAVEEAHLNIVTEKIPIPAEIDHKNMILPDKPVVMDIPTTVKIAVSEEKKQQSQEVEEKNGPPLKESLQKEESPKEVRHEPPQPEEPIEHAKLQKENEEKSQEKNEFQEIKQKSVVEPVQAAGERVDKKEDALQKEVIDKKASEVVTKKAGGASEIEKKDMKKVEILDAEAIKKEDAEQKNDETKKEKDSNQILIETIQKQNEVQKEIVEQQKKLIEVIQMQQESGNQQDADKVNEEKVKAVKQIEDIAKRAIESISGQDNKKIVKNNDNNVKDNDANKQPKANFVPILEEKQSEVEINKDHVKKDDEKMVEVKQEKKVVNLIGGTTNEVKSVKENVNQDIKNISNKMPMIPLAIALAKIANATVENKPQIPNKNLSNSADAEVKAMRRDILAESNTEHSIAKREIGDKKNLAVKEVCEEVSKLPSTEKPIIKMLCKLSEPNLMQPADLNIVENKEILGVKPQKRDLKHFSEE